MKRFIIGLCCLLALAACAAAKPVTEVDAYIDPQYDFSGIKSIYLWPASIDEVPDVVSLSLPMRVDYWIENTVKENRGPMQFIVKSTDAVWSDVRFIHGPFGFGDPFENEETEKIFYSNLAGACGAVLKTSVSVQSERKWQEPRVEYYWTTISIPAGRPHRRRGRRRGGFVWGDIEIPVRRERVVPGYWYTVASVQCGAELYDTDNPDKFIAAANAYGEDSGRGSGKLLVSQLTKKTVEDAAAAIFNR